LLKKLTRFHITNSVLNEILADLQIAQNGERLHCCDWIK